MVKSAIQNSDNMMNMLVPDHSAYLDEVHGDVVGDDGVQMDSNNPNSKHDSYASKKQTVSVEAAKAKAATIERIIQISRHDKDLGLILGLSGCHVIGFANERLIHDFELGDQIVAVNNQPVGCSMEMCRAV